MLNLLLIDLITMSAYYDELNYTADFVPQSQYHTRKWYVNKKRHKANNLYSESTSGWEHTACSEWLEGSNRGPSRLPIGMLWIRFVLNEGFYFLSALPCLQLFFSFDGFGFGWKEFSINQNPVVVCSCVSFVIRTMLSDSFLNIISREADIISISRFRKQDIWSVHKKIPIKIYVGI